MVPIFLDYETFYSDDYSLRKMTPVEYILDPRFECIGCAVKIGEKGNPFWVEGPDIPTFFDGLDASDTWLVSHNALFDACVTSWRYDFVPRLTTCTLNVARALISHKSPRLGLAAVARELGLPAKGTTLGKVKGMGLAALKFSPTLYNDFIEYALHDVELCAAIFTKLVSSGKFPPEELAVMDMVLRTATQPQFELDATLLAEHHAAVVQSKNELLARSMLLGGNGKSSLTSNLEFAELLRNFGVEPPMKKSPTTGLLCHAFAKTDAAFLALLDHDDPSVQTLVAARLGHKSTLEETRSKRLLSIAHLQWPDGKTGRMPMPLRYSGAHTHRLSGDWKLNVQNFTRGGKLRKALKAPPGHVVIASDASQIEARLTAWLCQEYNLLGQFARGEDVYRNFACHIFRRMPDQVTPEQRFTAKQAILGLGFGLGWPKFQLRIKTDSKNQTGKMIVLDDAQAHGIVKLYRDTFAPVPKTWRWLNLAVIPALRFGGAVDFGPCRIRHNCIILPSVTGDRLGLQLYYSELNESDGEYWFTYAGTRKKLYGGKLLENIVQALDRVIVLGAALRIQKLIHPYRLVQQAHDENVYIVREEHADLVARVVKQEMERRPPWAQELPLKAEVHIGPTYGDAK